MYDVNLVRNDFPVLKKVIYFDSAATTQTPIQVVEAMNEYFYEYAGNYGRGAHQLVRETTDRCESAREKVASFFNADPAKIIFTKNTTEGINMVSQGIEWEPEDHVITTSIEHHSNLVPWMRLRKKGVSVDIVPANKKGIVHPEYILSAIQDNTKLIAISHISNVLGSIQDIRSIIKIAHNNDIKVLIDGAQSAGHIPINLKSLKCDYFVAAGHKGLLGPQGTGILYIRDPDSIEPIYLGGGTVNNVNSSNYSLEPSPTKFEAGTPNIPGIIGLGRAIDYIEAIDIKNIKEHEHKLSKYAISLISEIPSLEIYGPKKRASVVPFNVIGMNSHDVAMIMNETKNICVRSGFHCAMPTISQLKVDGVIRASFALYNTMEEVEIFADTLFQISNLVS